jgi:hypothetical protein
MKKLFQMVFLLLVLIGLTDAQTNRVPFTQIQNISTARLLGRSSAGSGVIEQISVGSGLSLSGGTLSATGGGGGGAPTDAEYITFSANATLSAERVFTANNQFLVDTGTAGQFKLNFLGPQTSLQANLPATCATGEIRASTNHFGTSDGRIVACGGSNNWKHLLFSDDIPGDFVNNALSATQNDYNPNGLSYALAIGLTPTATVEITGFAAQANGITRQIVNRSTDHLIILAPESASSLAANRIAGQTPIFLMPGDDITLMYDGSSSRWRPLVAHGERLASQFAHADDFFATVGAFQTIVSGTGTSGQTATYLTNATERPIGVFQVDSGTTAAGRAFVGSAASNSIVPAQGPALFLARVAVESLSTATERFQVFCGLHDAAAATNVTDGVYWSYRDDVSATWQGGAAAASTRTETGAAGSTVGTNYVWLGFFVNANWSRADYFYSDDSTTWTLAGSISTNLPTATQLVQIGCGINKTIGTTQRNLSVDFMGVRYDLVRG